MSTVKINCNYALLVDPRISRTELTMNSLGGYQGAENVIPKAMTHGIPLNTDSRFSWSAIMYLYAIWDAI